MGKDNRFYSGPPIEGDHEFLWEVEKSRKPQVRRNSDSTLGKLKSIYGSQTQSKPEPNVLSPSQIMDVIRKAK